MLQFFDRLFAEATRQRVIARANAETIRSLERNLDRSMRMVHAGMYALAHYKPLVPLPMRDTISADIRAKLDDPAFDFKNALNEVRIQ